MIKCINEWWLWCPHDCYKIEVKRWFVSLKWGIVFSRNNKTYETSFEHDLNMFLLLYFNIEVLLNIWECS